jgi:hypothetical protein
MIEKAPEAPVLDSRKVPVTFKTAWGDAIGVLQDVNGSRSSRRSGGYGSVTGIGKKSTERTPHSGTAERQAEMERQGSYLMDNEEETVRLEIKTDPDAVREEARWCGVKPGMRIMDAGCGPGLTSFLLLEMARPGGEVVGVDYMGPRIQDARE